MTMDVNEENIPTEEPSTKGFLQILLLPIALRPFQFGLGFLYMVSEQFNFSRVGLLAPMPNPQLSWRTDDFLWGLSPLADQSKF
jgi:hypothetical protein